MSAFGRHIFATLAVLVGGSLAVLPSCDNQHEGERCDISAGNNGNDDCQAGLVCTAPDQLRWPVTTDGGIPQRPQTYICCPPIGGTVQPTTDVCKSAGSMYGSDAALPMTDGSMPEASSEASSDAPVDGPYDSPSDTSTSDAPSDATGD